MGEGVQKDGTLLKEAMERGLKTLAQYLKWCHELEVQKIFAVGTSALREAKNSKDFLKLVKEKINLPIDIISGEEEAHLSFLAVQKDLGEIEEPLLVVDVGGGSTEFILGRRDQISQWISLPLGSVRFTDSSQLRILFGKENGIGWREKFENSFSISLIPTNHYPW